MLDGIRIVDLSWGLAGPVATHLLAEVGADVIKVEPPQGDPVRRLAPAAFATWNRSKRGVVLDLKEERDRDRLDELLATADVLVHSLRPSKARAIGLDDDALMARFPRLVVTAVLGYPVGHPDAERPGWDILVQARTGAMDEMVAYRGGPMFLRFPLPSWSATYLAAAGIVARLVNREHTGRGGPAHTSLYQGMMAVLAMLWHRGERTTDYMKMKVPLSKASPGPALSMFECADGTWLQLVLGFTDNPLVLETIAEMGEFVDFDGPTPPPEAREVYKRAFLRRPRDEWLRALREGDVASAPVEGLGHVFDDEQAILNGYVVDVDDPVWGRVRQTLAPYRADPPAEVRGPAPQLGEHDLGAVLDRPAPAGGTRRDAGGRRAPLQGLKVLDFGMFLAGPLAPMLMADLGADVIKVEPLTGDRMRTEFQMTLFVGCQRGKRSIALDLQHPDSGPVLDALVRWADVVHHNLRLPAARRLGLDDESLRAINPDLVFCHVSSYGHTGPMKDFPGYDPIGQALSGWSVESAPPGEQPVWHRFGMMDHQCAMSSLLPTLMGVLKRLRTDQPSTVAGSLLAGATETNSETMRLASGDLTPYARIDAGQHGTDEGYRIYPTADQQWVAVAALDDATLVALRAVAGGGDIAASFSEQASGALLDALDAAGVPAELVRLDWENGFFDSELDRPSRLAVRYPSLEWGQFEQPGSFWELGEQSTVLDLAPPALGEHTDEILAALGFDHAAITALHDKKVVSAPGR